MYNRIYTGYTLVDITPTGVTRGQNLIARDQQRNWDTVLQTIGLSTQPHVVGFPRSIYMDLSLYKRLFGELYEGVHRVWYWTFVVDHEDIFADGDDPLARLRDQFAQVPVITGLEETCGFLLPIFYCEGAIKNIGFTVGYQPLNI